eukprot:3685632-Amphidinium_carterae.1
MVWQEHWSRLYAGKMLSTTRSFASPPKAWTAASLGEVSAEALFTASEVEAALKHQMTSKASVDGIPAKQMRCILQHLVPTWTKAFNYFMEVGDIPQIYKGTLIFVTPKKVAPSTPSDYRGLQLMMWSAKVFARALYMKCISRVEISIGQYVLGRNTGIDYPHVIVTQVSEWARIHRRRLGWWYVDLKTAFDKILRHLLFAPGHTLTLEMLVALGIDDRVARGILVEVAHDRPMLWEHNLPVELQRMLSSLLQDTWILLPPEQGEAQMSTHMGTPQGNSLSGLLYILYQQKIMQQITQYMHEVGISVVLPEVLDNTFEVSSTGTQEVPMLAYHDDALAVIESHSAESIVDKMRQLVDYAMTKYHGRNLLLNWSKLKSEIMFTMPPQELATFHATLNTEAKKRAWDHPAIIVKDFRIRVVRSYVYLGRRVVDNGSTNQHAKERAAIATATIHSFRRIYNCPRVKIEVKANLCTAMYTIPQLTSGFATLRPLDSRSEKTYSTSYLAAWKACLGKGRMAGATFAHISEERILDIVRKPSWTVHADALRLRFAIRLVRCTCPVVRASLGCTGLTKGSWWSAFASAANRLRDSVPQAADMPVLNDHTKAYWMQVIALDVATWKRWIKLYVKSDIDRRHATMLQEPSEAQQIEITEEAFGGIFPCFFCGKEFSTFRGMISHRRQAHKSDSGLSARVKDTTCISCGAQFETRQAHLAHLLGNLRCGLYTMTKSSRLTEPELVIARNIKTFMRIAPPKKGPKCHTIGDRPVTLTIPLMNIAIDDFT